MSPGTEDPTRPLAGAPGEAPPGAPAPAPASAPGPALPEPAAGGPGKASRAPEGEPGPADGRWHARDARQVRLEQLSGVIGASLLAGGLGLAALAATLLLTDRLGPARIALPAGLWLLLSALAYGLALRWPVLTHRHYRYRLDARGLEIRRGVLWRELVSVPRSRVQHTDLGEGPLERQLGLARLTVHTAGNHQATVTLPGLERRRATAMRDHLIEAEDDAG